MFGSWNELRLRRVISSSSAALDHDRGLVEILLRCSRITSLQKTVYYFEFKKLKFCLVNVVSFCKNMNFITEKTPFLKKLGILPASCTQRSVSQKTVTCKKLCRQRLQLTYLETIQKNKWNKVTTKCYFMGQFLRKESVQCTNICHALHRTFHQFNVGNKIVLKAKGRSFLRANTLVDLVALLKNLGTPKGLKNGWKWKVFWKPWLVIGRLFS